MDGDSLPGIADGGDGSLDRLGPTFDIGDVVWFVHAVGMILVSGERGMKGQYETYMPNMILDSDLYFAASAAHVAAN